MVDAVMPVVLGDQTIVAGELVRVDRAALGDLLADHRAKRPPCDIGDWAGVDLAPPLQEPEGGHFAGGAPASEPLPVTAKVGLVGFDLTPQRRATFTLPRQVPTDDLIHPFCTVAVDPEHPSGLHDGNLQSEEVNELIQLAVR